MGYSSKFQRISFTIEYLEEKFTFRTAGRVDVKGTVSPLVSMDYSGSKEIGGRDYIIPYKAIYTWYISSIYSQLGDYMLPTTFYVRTWKICWFCGFLCSLLDSSKENMHKGTTDCTEIRHERLRHMDSFGWPILLNPGSSWRCYAKFLCSAWISKREQIIPWQENCYRLAWGLETSRAICFLCNNETAHWQMLSSDLTAKKNSVFSHDHCSRIIQQCVVQYRWKTIHDYAHFLHALKKQP